MCTECADKFSWCNDNGGQCCHDGFQCVLGSGFALCVTVSSSGELLSRNRSATDPRFDLKPKPAADVNLIIILCSTFGGVAFIMSVSMCVWCCKKAKEDKLKEGAQVDAPAAVKKAEDEEIPTGHEVAPPQAPAVYSPAVPSAPAAAELESQSASDSAYVELSEVRLHGQPDGSHLHLMPVDSSDSSHPAQH
jgi:hypothetical protein